MQHDYFTLLLKTLPGTQANVPAQGGLKICGHLLPPCMSHPVPLLQPRGAPCRPEDMLPLSPGPVFLCRTCFVFADALSPSLQPCSLSACSDHIDCTVCSPHTGPASGQGQVPCGQWLPTDGWPRACRLRTEAGRPGSTHGDGPGRTSRLNKPGGCARWGTAMGKRGGPPRASVCPPPRQLPGWGACLRRGGRCSCGDSKGSQGRGRTEGNRTGGFHAHRGSRAGLAVALPAAEDKSWQ